MTVRRKWLAIAAGLVCVIVAASPWTLFGERLRESLTAQIGTTTGLDADIGGSTLFSLLPRPSVQLNRVVMRDRAGALRIESETVRGTLRLLPLLAGRFELAAIALRQPTFFVDLDETELRHAGALARASEAPRGSRDAIEADGARLGVLTIESGLAYFKDRATGVETLIEDIDATLRWPSVGAPATLTGLATWRGVSADLSVYVDKPGSLLRGETSAAALNLISAVGNATFEGEVSGGTHAQMSGRLVGEIPSLDRLMALFDAGMPLAGAIQTVSLAGDVRASAGELSLTGTHLKTDGNAFEGSLALSRSGGRPHLSGTLATDLLMFDPIITGLTGVAAQQSDRSPTEPAYNGGPARRLAHDLSLGDIDLRISAANARLAGMTFSDAAFSLLSNGGRIELSLAEARGYRGTVKGKGLIGTSRMGLDIRASASFVEADMQPLLADGFGLERLSGVGSGMFALETNGATVAELTQNLGGRGQIGLLQGEIAGLDVEQTLRRAEKRPLAGLLESRSGRTAFDRASATLVASNGSIAIQDGMLAGPGVSVSFGGAISLPDGSSKVRAVATLAGEAAETRGGLPQLSIDISGPWDNPSIRPDVTSLFSRQPTQAGLGQDEDSPTPKVGE